MMPIILLSALIRLGFPVVDSGRNESPSIERVLAVSDNGHIDEDVLQQNVSLQIIPKISGLSEVFGEDAYGHYLSVSTPFYVVDPRTIAQDIQTHKSKSVLLMQMTFGFGLITFDPGKPSTEKWVFYPWNDARSFWPWELR